jgi:hypothetical protein
LAQLSAGLVFGNDDVLADRKYRATLTCISLKGSIMILNKEEFLRIFRIENESWKVQFSQAKEREKSELHSLINFEKVKKAISRNETELSDSKTDNIKNSTLSFVNRLDLNIGAYSISEYHDDIHHGIFPKAIVKPSKL